MLIDQKATYEVVRQIVVKIAPNRALHEDLTQEAIIHLWLRETECPGQTESWYFQSCRFHLQNHMRTGRSVDSAKRQGALCPMDEACEPAGTSADESAAGGSLRALVCAREASRLLQEWLTPTECSVLTLLADGFSIREIAARMTISHTSVIRHRRRIATLASRLGIHPVPRSSNRIPKREL